MEPNVIKFKPHDSVAHAIEEIEKAKEAVREAYASLEDAKTIYVREKTKYDVAFGSQFLEFAFRELNFSLSHLRKI
jgi:hypothetical protein